MGINERKEREKERRRKDILDAAEKVFFSRGIDNSTMDEVAEVAELSKGTLYLYFNNKNELLLGLVGRALETLLMLFEKASNSKKTGFEKITALGDAYYRFYQQYPDYFAILPHRESKSMNHRTLKNNPNYTHCTEVGDKIFSLMNEVAKQGIDDGSIRQDLEPRKLSMVLWAHSSGALNLIRTKELFLRDKFKVSIEEFHNYSMRLMSDYLRNPDNQNK